MKLSEFPKKVRYTMTEYHLFATLPKTGKRVDSAHIVKERGDEWDVKFPLKNVTVHMNRLIDKVDANKEPFRIMKDGKYPGHPEVEYWLEERAATPKAAMRAKRRTEKRVNGK